MELKLVGVVIPPLKSLQLIDTLPAKQHSDAILVNQSTKTAKPTTPNTATAPIANMVSALCPNRVVEEAAEPEPTIGEESPQLVIASELGVEEEDVPSTVMAFSTTRFLSSVPSRMAHMVVARTTIEMINQQRSIKQDEKQAIYNLLKSLSSLGPIPPDIMQSCNIRGLLQNILGETPKPPRFPYSYPEPLQRSASLILTRLDAENATEEVDEEAISSSEPSTPTERAPKRRRTSGTGPSARLPSRLVDDSTFRHIMRGIRVSGEGRRTYVLDGREHKRDYNIVGHNGLTVGQWWPYRVCALRDGAHGSSMGGIAGSISTGAYSIVVSSESSTCLCPFLTIPHPR